MVCSVLYPSVHCVVPLLSRSPGCWLWCPARSAYHRTSVSVSQHFNSRLHMSAVGMNDDVCLVIGNCCIKLTRHIAAPPSSRSHSVLDLWADDQEEAWPSAVSSLLRCHSRVQESSLCSSGSVGKWWVFTNHGMDSGVSALDSKEENWKFFVLSQFFSLIRSLFTKQSSKAFCNLKFLATKV